MKAAGTDWSGSSDFTKEMPKAPAVEKACFNLPEEPTPEPGHPAQTWPLALVPTVS